VLYIGQCNTVVTATDHSITRAGFNFLVLTFRAMGINHITSAHTRVLAVFYFIRFPEAGIVSMFVWCCLVCCTLLSISVAWKVPDIFTAVLT
jgi:hypothetical protein